MGYSGRLYQRIARLHVSAGTDGWLVGGNGPVPRLLPSRCPGGSNGAKPGSALRHAAIWVRVEIKMAVLKSRERSSQCGNGIMGYFGSARQISRNLGSGEAKTGLLGVKQSIKKEKIQHIWEAQRMGQL